ncbi:MAG: hypothetical protein HC902_14825 [Calothrix sp. SM1_5_4]|nr:hypothetical protein [Calothrix sp. SM1_5_4]
MVILKCYHCGSELRFADRVGLREECGTCRNDVHVCRNCRFYDATAYNECREPQAEVVREKDRANHCEYFQAGTGAGGQGKSKDDLLKAAEALFKKK